MNESISEKFNHDPTSCQCNKWVHIQQGNGTKDVEDIYESAHRGYTSAAGAAKWMSKDPYIPGYQAAYPGSEWGIAKNHLGRFVGAFKIPQGQCSYCKKQKTVTDAY